MFGEGLCKIQRRALLAPLSLQGQVEEVVTRTQKRTMCRGGHPEGGYEGQSQSVVIQQGRNIPKLLFPCL